MTRPKVVFLENVQNLLSHDKQATFKTIVDTLDRQLDYHIVGVTHDEKGETQYERSAFCVIPGISVFRRIALAYILLHSVELISDNT